MTEAETKRSMRVNERMVEMESAVFIYFFSIGAGLALGVVSIALPTYWLYKKMRGGKEANVKQTKQRSSL